MFTLEIGDKPIAITDADGAQARVIFESDEFKQDLTAMTSEGIPLWDGRAPLPFGPHPRRRPLHSRLLTWISTMISTLRRTMTACL
jgi:hypothetical protein